MLHADEYFVSMAFVFSLHVHFIHCTDVIAQQNRFPLNNLRQKEKLQDNLFSLDTLKKKKKNSLKFLLKSVHINLIKINYLKFSFLGEKLIRKIKHTCCLNFHNPKIY